MLDRFTPDSIVLLGDVVDHNAISFWDRFPELPSAMEEYRSTKRAVAKWKKLIPKAKVCIGNHDERVHRVVRKSGVPGNVYLKEYNEVWELDNGWEWAYEHTIGNVLFTHGHGSSTAENIAQQRQQSTVSGHLHTKFRITYHADLSRRYWGMNAGCLLDREHPAMEYAYRNKEKPILGVGLIVNGLPQLIPMELR